MAEGGRKRRAALVQRWRLINKRIEGPVSVPSILLFLLISLQFKSNFTQGEFASYQSVKWVAGRAWSLFFKGRDSCQACLATDPFVICRFKKVQGFHLPLEKQLSSIPLLLSILGSVSASADPPSSLFHSQLLWSTAKTSQRWHSFCYNPGVRPCKTLLNSSSTDLMLSSCTNKPRWPFSEDTKWNSPQFDLPKPNNMFRNRIPTANTSNLASYSCRHLYCRSKSKRQEVETRDGHGPCS